MTPSPLGATRKQAYQLVVIAVLVVIIISLSLSFLGKEISRSMLYGAGIWVLPNLCFVYRVFGDLPVQKIKTVTARLYQAEILKLCLLGVCAVLAIHFLDVKMWAFLAGFMIAQIVFWVVAIIFYSRVKVI